jgi:hypothetical protein
LLTVYAIIVSVQRRYIELTEVHLMIPKMQG